MKTGIPSKGRLNPRGAWRWAIILLGLGSILLSLSMGAYPISLVDIWEAIWGTAMPERHTYVLLSIRLPRLLIALTSGAILALSGFYMQVLIRNPLADPYIMGVTAGAGLGVNLLILGIIPLSVVTYISYPLFAGLGALGSLLLILVLGFKTLQYNTYKLLIAGIAVSSICTAFIGLLIYLYADSDQVRRIVFWTFGSLGRAQNWEAVYLAIGLWVISLSFGLRYGNHLDVLAMGELQAEQLGMNARTMKFRLLLVSTLTVGALVAFTGPIGFVGMMVPHIARNMFGTLHRKNLLWGSILGGVFLNTCDAVARLLLPPGGLPIGIITALVGIPFFLYLLFSDSKFLS